MPLDLFGEPISVYSRAQALDDGELVDASAVAREAGFVYPVSLTRAVWRSFVEVPHGVRCQDESGRLWDILHMLAYAIRRASDRRFVSFSFFCRNHNRQHIDRRDLVTLKAVCGAGDDGEPCITIMQPDES